MPIKSIVVHLADDRRYRTRLQLAVGVANRFDAHLNAAYATEPVDFPTGAIGRAISLESLDEKAEKATACSAKIEREVEASYRGHLKSRKWRVERGGVERAVATAKKPVVWEEASTWCIHSL